MDVRDTWDEGASEALGPRLSEVIALALRESFAAGLRVEAHSDAADAADLITDRVLDAFQIRSRPSTTPRGTFGSPLRLRD